MLFNYEQHNSELGSKHEPFLNVHFVVNDPVLSVRGLYFRDANKEILISSTRLGKTQNQKVFHIK